MMKITNKISIQKLPATQWELYRAFRLSALQDEPLAFGKCYEEEVHQPKEYWLERIKNMLFAMYDGEPLAMIGLRVLPTKKHTHIAEITSVYVKASMQKQGVGKTIMEVAIDSISKNKDVRKILVNVTVSQVAAVNLYERMGFVVVGRLRDDLWYQGEFHDALIMEKYI